MGSLQNRGIGTCIYCGHRPSPDAEFRLGAEHIIPKGLGGTNTVLKASCRSCEQVINLFETAVMRGFFGDFRIHRSLSRTKSKRHTLPVILQREEGQARIEVDLADHPHALIMPLFPPAGLLCKRQAIEVSDLAMVVVCRYQPDYHERAKRVLGPEGGTGMVGTPYMPFQLARMLAKSAHAFAAKNLGLHGFVPFLPAVILGSEPDFTQVFVYVGGSTCQLFTYKMHGMSLSTIEHSGKRYVLVRIRLFAQVEGTPTYEVVVGERVDETAA